MIRNLERCMDLFVVLLELEGGWVGQKNLYILGIHILKSKLVYVYGMYTYRITYYSNVLNILSFITHAFGKLESTSICFSIPLD